MLKRALENPLRLFIIVAAFTFLGIWAGINLPVSLYPQTSKPVVKMYVYYGGLSSQEFIRKYGANIEYQLEGIKNTGLPLDNVIAEYASNSVNYTITYDWKVPFGRALKEVEAIAASAKGFLPKESADSVSVWQWSENGGFLAISFYSSRHSLNELYDILDPLLAPGLKKIPDSKDAGLWNPESQAVSIALLPEKMAMYGLMPGEIFRSLEGAVSSMTGGQIRLGQESASFHIPSSLKDEKDLENHLVKLKDGRRIFLKDVAKIMVGRFEENSRGFKTNGKESLILFAEPKSGANVKRMAEDVLDLVRGTEKSFPKGIEYRILVDPSEFIRGSIQNLLKDVALAAFLAVFVLYLFIGNFRNVATAAVEIPLSMVLAFIVMYATGMNLNLISLGGLALAAGMNVDASVVVLENIFRHQDQWIREGRSFSTVKARFELVLNAVKEIAAPVFLSIATTLIVFIPLALTTDLTNAILGDLAKAVIYSHGVSGFVAILLVPAIRIILMKGAPAVKKTGPLDAPLRRLEVRYISVLDQLIGSKKIKYAAVIVPLLLAFVSIAVIVPKLPKEIIGTPDTDWIYIAVSAPQSASNRQMENILQEVESKAMKEGGDATDYTFVQINRKNNGSVMLRLKDKSKMKPLVKKMQKVFTNTPEVYFFVDSWNPAELPLPSMHHLDVIVAGKNSEEIKNTASRLQYFLKEKGDYKRLQLKPSDLHGKIHQFVPYKNIWTSLELSGAPFAITDMLDLTVYANGGKGPGSININGKLIPINVRFDDERFQDPSLLGAYPLKLKDKVFPLSALGRFETVSAPSNIFRQDGREQARVSSTLDKGEEGDWEKLAERYSSLIKKHEIELTNGKDVVIDMQPPQKELLESLDQLKSSLFISLGLIFLVLWLQFQSVRQVMVIMMTIPLGLIGAFPALYLFGSTLSLNSALGVLLLNGIAVGNAILLVEVVNHLSEKGVPLRDAVLEACRSRLRPILITSLSGALGMLPIAMGWGDGGKILQPLGITVSCGILVSMATTLLIIPVLLYRPQELRSIDTPVNLDLSADLMPVGRDVEHSIEKGPLQ